MKKQPNILFLMADELRADVTGFGGNGVVRTPNLDRLAGMSTVFDAAYTPSPICIPGRQCLTAGQFTVHCGCNVWMDDLTPGYPTFPRLLSENGYATVACGKLHHVGPDQMQGYTTRIGADCTIAPPYVENRKVERPAASAKKWSQTKEVLQACSGVKSYHIVEDEMTALGAQEYIDKYFVDEFYGRATPELPLLLTASFNQPHYPYVADQELLDYYMDRVPVYENQPVFDHPFLSMHRVDVPSPALRKATAAYYAMVEKVDGYVGGILKALEKAGQNIEDWMVVFTSDHGEMLGEHGVWEKQKFFEGSARVPLFIHLPGQTQPRRCEKNVNLCDLFATVAVTAGLPVPGGLDSRDLTGLVNGTQQVWDDESISMFGGTNLMIKWGSVKYQYYRTDDSEVLFDLHVQPDERENLIARPEYAQLLPKLRRRAQEFGFTPGKTSV